jgi:hypothetical protein
VEWNEDLSDGQRITDIRQRFQDNECILTWKWPGGIQFVYLYGFQADAEIPPENRPDKVMKLYTREEYKAKMGYRTHLETIGRYAFRVYPCQRTAGEMTVYKQEDEDNIILFSTGKARIRYSIKYGRAFFSKRRAVRIELHSEVHIPKDALCYVKKEGTFPLHKEDGTAYPFIHDVLPGRNVLPEIEINKQDQLKLFFTDGKKYGDIYELIPE